MEYIRAFRDEHRFLSNFWPVQLVFGSWLFASAEHAYQAAKSLDPKNWAKVQACRSPVAAKRLGKNLALRPDWEDVKLEVMTEILTAKFEDPYLRQMLLDTGDTILVEGNTWGDTFWGSCRGKGENHLGRILMNIRTDIRINKLVNQERIGTWTE